ncbi:MAG TPA: endonuclease/exonuclease/phosphatase family protein [Burkholderiaceae bacterium]|nr:endonuclease/exonuclease/phosphatase family protein [Burkholderiaceae bacterium]
MRRVLRGLLGAGLLASWLAFAGLTLVQRLALDEPWLELSRYLPWYWMAAALGATLVAALALGRAWVLAALASLAVLAAVTMDFQWHAPRAAAAPLRVVTYNAKVQEALARPGGIAALEAEVRRLAPDVLLLQDAEGLRTARAGAAIVDGPPLFGLPHVAAVSQYVIASRLPLRECRIGRLDVPGASHRSLRCRVEHEGASLWIVNAHLLTPRGGLMAARRDPIDGVETWEENLARRLVQARQLAAEAAGIAGPRIVAGDLNATEASPVVQALRAVGLRDAFSEAGRGWGFSYGHTMRWGLPFLRIDHILVSREFEVLSSSVGGGDASAHRPVVADLAWRAAGR